MKLAEGLLLRNEYQQKLDTLQQRVMDNLKIQEGDAPHEDPKALLAELTATNEKLCALVKSINRTNATARLPDGRTLADALADRDMLRKERTLLADLAQNAAQRDFRVTHAEVRMVSTVDVGALQKRVDDLSRQFRELDTLLQGVNWTIDMAD